MSLLSLVVVRHHSSLLLSGALLNIPPHLLVLSPSVLHDDLQASPYLLRVRRACLNLLSTDDFALLLAKDLEHRHLGGGEDELGVCIKDINSEQPILQVAHQLHILVLYLAH